MIQKKITAILLCAALLAAGISLPASAAERCNCGQTVEVFLDGFGSTLYYDQGTPQERKAGFVETDNLAPAIFKLLGYTALSAVTLNGAYAGKGLAALMMGLMGHLAMDEQGRSLRAITANWHIDESIDHSQSPKYTFLYDWRGDPFDAATQLNDFIEHLCELTGHETIALNGFSEGSVVAMTYVKEYGTDRLESLLIVNGAWQGLTLVGELLTKQIALSGSSVTEYLAGLPDESGWLAPSMNLIQRLHLLDFLDPLSGCIIRAMGDALYKDALIPLFCHMPAVWAFVPDAYYTDARKLLEGQKKYETLLEQVDKYHYEVQKEAENLLRQAMDNGVKVGIVCGYGYSAVPATKAQSYHTDNLIDTALASGGATVAPYGQTLPQGDSSYRSLDGVIDAASCMFPEQTWFIKGLRHEYGPSGSFRDWFVAQPEQPTIHDSTDFPQYR